MRIFMSWAQYCPISNIFQMKNKEIEKPEYFTDYKTGDTINGRVIGVIYNSTVNYIVYSPKKQKNTVSYSFRGYAQDIFNPISALLTEISGLRNRLNDPSKYNSAIASAHVQCLNQNPENAIQILVSAKLQMQKDFAHEAKIGYLQSTIFIVAFNTIIALILFYTKKYIDYGLLREYFTVATFGSFGGFLSTYYKINKLNFEKEDNKRLLFFLSVSRVMLAMLSSVIIYILIKSNIILGILNNATNVYVYYIFAVVAGFSETFIPDILRKIEKKSTEDHK